MKPSKFLVLPIGISPELCNHQFETITRVAHGYLGDAPKGTVQVLCSGCGSEVHAAS